MNQAVFLEQFSNGLRVVVEEIPTLRSVSLGLWIQQGSRNESDEQAGLSHFTEHLLFKGTKSRSCRDIAESIDKIGGNLDAVTDREFTGYFAKVLDSHFDEAMELFADIVLHPRFDIADIDLERGVVLEEIKMVQDSPDDLANDLFMGTFFNGHPLGRSVLGNAGSVSAFKREDVSTFFQERYTPDRMILAVAGNVKAGKVLRTAKKLLGRASAGEDGFVDSTPDYRPSVAVIERESMEQIHLLLGANAFAKTDARRHALNVLNTYLGSTVSSRLFQNVRERRGLAYAISSFANAYKDCGLLGIYAATSPDKFDNLLEAILEELAETADGKIDEPHIERMKTSVKGDIILGLENSANRMALLAQQLIYFGKIRYVREVLEELNSVGTADVVRVAETVFRGAPLTFTAVGNLGGLKPDISHIVVP